MISKIKKINTFSLFASVSLVALGTSALEILDDGELAAVDGQDGINLAFDNISMISDELDPTKVNIVNAGGAESMAFDKLSLGTGIRSSATGGATIGTFADPIQLDVMTTGAGELNASDTFLQIRMPDAAWSGLDYEYDLSVNGGFVGAVHIDGISVGGSAVTADDYSRVRIASGIVDPVTGAQREGISGEILIDSLTIDEISIDPSASIGDTANLDPNSSFIISDLKVENFQLGDMKSSPFNVAVKSDGIYFTAEAPAGGYAEAANISFSTTTPNIAVPSSPNTSYSHINDVQIHYMEFQIKNN